MLPHSFRINMVIKLAVILYFQKSLYVYKPWKFHTNPRKYFFKVMHLWIAHPKNSDPCNYMPKPKSRTFDFMDIIR